jgi:hypothetical protein
MEREDKQGKLTFKSLGDKTLYDGIDSAMKAAFYWKSDDIFRLTSTYSYVAVYIPILVTLVPFWEVPIDGGKTGAPIVSRRVKRHEFLTPLRH